MEFIELINNRNLKKLLKKKYLTEDLLFEIKTSLFIHPCTPEGDGMYAFNIVQHGENKVFELFTSLDEYCYGDEFTPLFWHFHHFPNSFGDDIAGIIINPKSDNFFIPASVCFHIFLDIMERNRSIEIFSKDYTVDDLKRLKDKKTPYLEKYLEGKSRISQIPRFFRLLDRSIAFCLISSQQCLDDYIRDGVLSSQDVHFNIHKREGSIVVFTSKKAFESEIANSDNYFYYTIADMIFLCQLVFELDYEGIIIKTPDEEFFIKRSRLLKYFDKIVESYESLGCGCDYAFRLEESK